MKNSIPLILAVLLGLAAVFAVNKIISENSAVTEEKVKIVAATRDLAAGEGDLPVDYQKMISLFTAAALGGHPDAQYELGFCYENGLGVPINVGQAKSWYDKSAAQGNEKAARRGKALGDIK